MMQSVYYQINMIMDRISEESGVEKIVKTEEIFEYVQKQYGTVPYKRKKK